ncbi:5-formyltetrahydrofolate cyclo-ligase [Gelidibacter sediminis]|uniref:5-formyltetrahydrofolate cyclo-ligase n=1 Tax=Gelidibacter sediminis TaxID=1608710 RepID=A0A4R7Q830_9FLAO|nr:5-formyltetrahydrofolate cyclo-ligase [Gelidibacter sediminis]TDU43728.1 5-formyltetrahydrofolate cyclo-ligase [Gelidibacter sediminis]
MNKAALRTLYKLKRQALSIEAIDNGSLEIANQLLKLPIWNASYYHVFLSIAEHKEINTEYILNILSGKDKNIIISKSDFKTFKMTNYLLLDNTVIKKNAWNIPEPVDGIVIDSQNIDVVFVPLLAFDQQGHRVGYGKGFYDTFLSECRPETIKIGLSLFDPEDKIDDVFENDVALDYCVTPQKSYIFK